MAVWNLEVGKRYRNTRTGREFLVGDVNELGGVCDDCQDLDLVGGKTYPHDLSGPGWYPDLEEVQ